MRTITRSTVIIFMMLVLACSSVTCAASDVLNNKGALNDEQTADLHFQVSFDILFSKYIIFCPNYFGQLYGTGTKFEDAIDSWKNYNYTDSLEDLLEIENAILESDSVYYPDDMAFVREAIGLLYLDRAVYDKAYDYLISAYVIMKDAYYESTSLTSLERLYLEASQLSMIQYYHETGDYDSCLQEAERLREYDKNFGPMDEGELSYQLLLQIDTNEVEASICNVRGEYERAYDLFSENVLLCNENKLVLNYLIAVRCQEEMADWHAQFYGEEFAEIAVFFYDLALTMCEKQNDANADHCKLALLMKKGKYLLNFPKHQEEGRKALDEAIALLGKLNEQRELTIDVIDSLLRYAEVLGFADNDMDEAQRWYDSALQLSEFYYGHNHPQTAKVYESLGRFYGNRKNDVDQAIEYFTEGTDIFKTY